MFSHLLCVGLASITLGALLIAASTIPQERAGPMLDYLATISRYWWRHLRRYLRR